MVAVFKKELRSYFVTLTAYIYLSVFFLLSALFFVFINIDGGSPFFSQSLGGTTFVFLILTPMLTMRLFSEEARQRTDQLLFTSPLKVWRIVAGKYAAAVTIYLISLMMLMMFPIILSRYTDALYAPEVFGMFVGFFLMGASFIAIGLFISALTDNQIISAVATFGFLFVIYLMDMVAAAMPSDRMSSGIFIAAVIAAITFYIYVSSKNRIAAVSFAAVCGAVAAALRLINPNLYDGMITKFLVWFNAFGRFTIFSAGIFRLTDMTYYITFTFVFLFLTAHVIERRRWK
jgi:ABC-2 type transport system permease protein